MNKLIDVKNLTLQFDTDEGRITAVDDVSFSLAPGESWDWSAKAALENL